MCHLIDFDASSYSFPWRHAPDSHISGNSQNSRLGKIFKCIPVIWIRFCMLTSLMIFIFDFFFFLHLMTSSFRSARENDRNSNVIISGKTGGSWSKTHFSTSLAASLNNSFQFRPPFLDAGDVTSAEQVFGFLFRRNIHRHVWIFNELCFSFSA